MELPGRLAAVAPRHALHVVYLVVVRERAGRPISMADAQIAAICRSHGASLATRNVDDFENIDLKIINPWTDQ